MNITDLRNAVNGIDFDREKQRQMMLEIRAKKRPHRYTGVLRAPGVVAVCILTVGILSVPVRAVVNSLVRERMESLPEKEIAKVAEQIKRQSTEANSATREYTAGEKERRGKLYAQYLNGLFPEGELAMVDSEEEAAEQEFCFLTTTGVFYLPLNRDCRMRRFFRKLILRKSRTMRCRSRTLRELLRERRQRGSRSKR